VTAGVRRSTWVMALLGLALAALFSVAQNSPAQAAASSTSTTAAATTSTTAADPKEYVQGCFTCHSRENLGAVEVGGESKSLYVDQAAYQASVHGLHTCNGCHLGFSHNPHAVVSNAADFAQIARESCRSCHANQFAMYEDSYHGTLKKGESAQGINAPDCVDCHGAHDVRPATSAAFRSQIADICGRCHGARKGTYLDTYHGKAVLLGREAAATCTDCHGTHSILPVGNARSTLSSQNILATCQKCHPDANKNFASFRVHITATSPKAPSVVFWVSLFYIVLIAGVFTFGGVHSILYIYRGVKDRSYSRRKGGH
jgi:predicted CXXCH cytochrome family protein